MTISAPRIAVLEDDPAFREVLLAILDDQHLAGMVLDPGAGAIAQLLELRPHVAIIDWHLVGMGSAETAEELLRDIAADPDLVAMRTILLLGRHDRGARDRPVDHGRRGSRGAREPFDVDTFVGVLERALRRAGVAEDATLRSRSRGRRRTRRSPAGSVARASMRRRSPCSRPRGASATGSPPTCGCSTRTCCAASRRSPTDPRRRSQR